MTRGTRAIFNCENCGNPFSARTADRARGWARFCSKSCKAAEQEKRTGQNARYHARVAERGRDRAEAARDDILYLATGPADEWR